MEYVDECKALGDVLRMNSAQKIFHDNRDTLNLHVAVVNDPKSPLF
jgi:hypothetical protein